MSGEGVLPAAPATAHRHDLDLRALALAVDAYDEARVAKWRREGAGTGPMSQSNKLEITPLIAAAISAYLDEVP